MSAKHKKDVELLLSHMPDNGFLQILLNRLRTGMGLTSNQLGVLESMKASRSSQQAKVNRVKESVLVEKRRVRKKASVSRVWDYDRGEWAYRVGGGKIKYASEKVLDYKVEWGDPPKPNLWRAIIKGGLSDGRIEVTSPLMPGRIVFNIFLFYIFISYRRKGYSAVDLGTISRKRKIDSIFSHATYTKYIKPAILSGALELGSQGKKIASGEGFEG